MKSARGPCNMLMKSARGHYNMLINSASCLLICQQFPPALCPRRHDEQLMVSWENACLWVCVSTCCSARSLLAVPVGQGFHRPACHLHVNCYSVFPLFLSHATESVKPWKTPCNLWHFTAEKSPDLLFCNLPQRRKRKEICKVGSKSLNVTNPPIPAIPRLSPKLFYRVMALPAVICVAGAGDE